jgi:hypothetical protein
MQIEKGYRVHSRECCIRHENLFHSCTPFTANCSGRSKDVLACRSGQSFLSSSFNSDGSSYLRRHRMFVAPPFEDMALPLFQSGKITQPN